MNSFRSVERAIAFEIDRQAAALDAGEPLVQETRGWDDERGVDVPHAAQGDVATTTATSPSRTCRRCTSTPLARRAPGRAAGAAGGAPCALPGGLGLSAYDAAVLVADPRCDRRCSRRPSRPARAPGRSPSRTGSPASTSRLRKVAVRTPRRSIVDRGGARGDRRAPSRPGELSRANAQGGLRGARRDRRDRSRRSSTRAASARSRDAARSGAVVDEVLAANPAAVADYRAGKAAGDRLPRRPGHEGDARPGERGARPGGRARAPRRGRRRADAMGSSTSCSGSAGVVLIAVGYTRARGPVGALPGAQGAGRERRALRVVARRPPRRRRTTGAVGRDGRCCAARPRSARARSRSSGFVLVVRRASCIR